LSLVVLSGCRPEPLAGYLKALGALRLVSEQVDPAARGAWVGGVFHLESTLTEAGLVDFFARRYAPTPVITPWNGGSGFWPGDNQSGISPIRVSDSPRFEAYRSAITVAEAHIRRSGLEERPDSKQKTAFVSRLRATLSDAVLAWLDAALVFSRETLVFPPLLGTGGNDGRLDFANNFMQRLSEELLAPNATPEAALRGALFGGPTMGLGDAAIGQFFPSAAGGANCGPGFEGSVGTNPWDFILLVEGAVCFAAAVARKWESGSHSAMVFPFSVRSTAAGFGSAAAGETKSKDELWLPIWSGPSTWMEVATVIREGRSRVGRRPSVTGADFARSLASLGVDRGIASFSRFAFHKRNGESYQAVPPHGIRNRYISRERALF
jgi:CRISPR-associated protein Csx17